MAQRVSHDEKWALAELRDGIDIFQIIRADLAPLLGACTLARLQSLSCTVKESFSGELATRKRKDQEVGDMMWRRCLAICWSSATAGLWARAESSQFPATHQACSWCPAEIHN